MLLKCQRWGSASIGVRSRCHRAPGRSPSCVAHPLGRSDLEIDDLLRLALIKLVEIVGVARGDGPWSRMTSLATCAGSELGAGPGNVVADSSGPS